MSAGALTRHILPLRLPAGAFVCTGGVNQKLQILIGQQQTRAKVCYACIIRDLHTRRRAISQNLGHLDIACPLRVSPERSPTNLGNATCNSGGNRYSGGINFNNNTPSMSRWRLGAPVART